MPLTIVNNDIVRMETDAIVNVTNELLYNTGGICSAIFQAAGQEEMTAACRSIGRCSVGSAVITPGFNLPAKYVIHVVPPVWRGGLHRENELLRASYISALKLAEEHNIKSLAFPLISLGISGFQRQNALELSLTTIREYLNGVDDEPEIFLVLLDRQDIPIDSVLSEMLFSRSGEGSERPWQNVSFTPEEDYFLPETEHSVPLMPSASGSAARPKVSRKEAYGSRKESKKSSASYEISSTNPYFVEEAADYYAYASSKTGDLSERLRKLDASFSETLLKLIDEKGLTDAEAYKKANIDRKHFSKIRSDRLYQPRKTTVLAFAVALRLNVPETNSLLGKAGYVLSASSTLDVIVQYYLEKHRYNIDEINSSLFAYDQPLLGM